MIGTIGKRKATQKIKYAEYIHVIAIDVECKISLSISKKL